MMLQLALFVLLLVADAAEQQQAAQFGEINIAVLTDVHSWAAGHQHADHKPALDADVGSISSAVHHLKAAAAVQGKDVFFLNNGDHTEGSGLSDASVYTTGIHGSDLFPLLAEVPFDALTIGNHDLYDNSTTEFMRSSGFISSWDGRYLTSNVLNATTQEPLAGTHAILRGSVSDVSVLVFGFIYHQTDACRAVTVVDPKVSTAQPWFKAALQQGLAAEVSAIVVLSHMDLKDDSVSDVLAAIRGAADSLPELATLPVQFLTGHTHYRGFNQLEDRASSFEAGHYLDTLGWVSFNVSEKGAVQFVHEFVDASRATLMSFTGTSESDFDTPQGLALSKSIATRVADLDLAEVLGCPHQSYSQNAHMDANNSLYRVYIDKIVPPAVFPAGDASGDGGAVPFHVTSTGSLRYDVYANDSFYYDDVFAIAPFANLFQRYAQNLTSAQLSTVLSTLNAPSFVSVHKGEKADPQSRLPSFVGGPGKPDDAAKAYSLIINEYDAPNVASAVATATGRSAADVTADFKPWRQDKSSADFVDTTLVWKLGAPSVWPC